MDLFTHLSNPMHVFDTFTKALEHLKICVSQEPCEIALIFTIIMKLYQLRCNDLERASDFPQVPLLADAGDWAPAHSCVHFLMSHHTCLWPSVCMCVTRTTSGAVMTLLKEKIILSLAAKQQWP